MIFNSVEVEILSRIRLAPIVCFLAGIIEFVLCGLMFLMAAFALTGLVVLSYLPTVHEPSAPVQFYIGVLAIFAFIFALAGSASAIRRWSVLLSVIGASLVALWGLLENWYALTWLFSLGDFTAWTNIQTAVTLGTLALFLSMLVIIMVVAARKEFKPHALSRASLE